MASGRSIADIRREIDRMIEDRRATRLINPVLTLFYLKEFQRTGNRTVEFAVVKQGYEDTVCDLIKYHLHHNFNVGGQFNDSYLHRLASRHQVLEQVRGKDFAIVAALAENAQSLVPYITNRMTEHLTKKLFNVTKLYRVVQSKSRAEVCQILDDPTSRKLRQFLESGFQRSSASFLSIAYGFEICMFAILKVLLAKFGCKVYRDSKTYSSDKGTDLGTNFGVVYQVKKKCIATDEAFISLLNELLVNFADGRIQGGNVFVIVEDIDGRLRKRLQAEHINCLTRKGITDFLDKFDADEKWEILKQIAREFGRELMSDVCRSCKKPGHDACPYSPTKI